MNSTEKKLTDPRCRAECMITGPYYRFSILTSRLIRMEYDPDGQFEDRPTQLAINRNFPVPAFSVYEEAGSLEIQTEHLSLYYDKQPFSAGGLSIKVRSKTAGIYSTWHFGDKLDENLGGTARTLDQADGAITLEPGVQSRLQGFSVLDDSHSIVFLENGWFENRSTAACDLYFFGYGLAYQDCIRDYFRLSGAAPLLPRWTLGNWWSRFYPYTSKSYLDLMEHFEAERTPLSVAVIDMDWHITDVAPEDGKGWTGYTWNRKLFPQPEAFLEALHRKGLKVALNDHPAEGIQPHEERYRDACASMGMDAASRRPIPFDFTSPDYVRTYFTQILHPLEREGVDLWWVDWQQGGGERFQVSDPLLLLNHYHTCNRARCGKRAMTFSRYAGPGSHRYPIGFSGDTIISWASLDFQPYFTASAANIGYGWWSHDIGGHCAGSRDEELMVRWVQFGVFSPMMRLHSTSNLFNGKEPWNYGPAVCQTIERFLRLRHQLIPYLYTMNWLYHTAGVLPVRPMYYAWPEEDAAYAVPNQYEFGTQLLVCPITTPMRDAVQMGCVTAWLPEGQYYDFFSGVCYQGGRKIRLYRPLEQIPVLAPAGAIVPMTKEEEAAKNGVSLPQSMEIRIFCGKSGAFTLYEDDGESTAYQEGAYVKTNFELNWKPTGVCTFRIAQKGKDDDFLPQRRQYTLALYGISELSACEVTADGIPAAAQKTIDRKNNRVLLDIPAIRSESVLQVTFSPVIRGNRDSMLTRAFEILNRMKIGYEQKERIYRCIESCSDVQRVVSTLYAMDLDRDVLGALIEVVTG